MSDSVYVDALAAAQILGLRCSPRHAKRVLKKYEHLRRVNFGNSHHVLFVRSDVESLAESLKGRPKARLHARPRLPKAVAVAFALLWASRLSAQIPVQGSVKLAAQAVDPVVAGQPTSGVDYVQFAVDGVDVGPRLSASPYEYVWDSTTKPNGVHVVAARALDRAGNVGSAQIQVSVQNGVIDTTPPTVTIISPQNAQAVTGKINVMASAADAQGVASMKLLINGDVRASSASDAILYNWNTAPYKKFGNVPVVVTATDANGNTASQAVAVRVK